MLIKVLSSVFSICLVEFASCALDFVDPPTDRIAKLGHDVDLSCGVVNTATGTNQGLTIRWKYNDGLINPKNLVYPNGTLVITSAVESDLGGYKCQVYNDTNSVLVLTSEPAKVFTISFQEVPQHQAIVFGQDMFLNCSAQPLPTGTTERVLVQWKLSHLPINDKASMFSNGTLLVPNVDRNDTGNYTCSVLDSRNNIVLMSKPALVFHAYIKMFEVSPVNVFATEDEMISFDCITGESAPYPDVYWEKDGEPFNGGNQYVATYGGYPAGSLSIQYSMRLLMRAKPYLDGAYTCVARNNVLQISVRSMKVRLQTIEMESAPYVMEELVVEEVMAALGQPFILNCPIDGKPHPSMTWYRNRVPVDGLSQFFTLKNGSLHSPEAMELDQAVYHCEGSNSLGIATSPNITVTLARIDIAFKEQPRDLYKIAGLPATLKCSPPYSVPLATITWYKDNALLVPRTGEQSMIVVTTADNYWNIQFEEIQKQDEGEYFCVATNELAVPKTRTSQKATIRVGGAPIFVEPPIGLTIQKGKLAQLTCYVQGDPFPEVTWLFENDVMEPSETVSFRQGNQELWIGDIHKGNEGTYTCRAVNRYGAIQTKVYVKVLVPPVVLEKVGVQTVSKGETVILPCGIYSDPAATITWYKDSAALEMAGRFTQLPKGLYITSVEVADSGSYTCQATNMAGTVETTGTLDVLVLPHFSETPKSQVVTIGKNVTLTCVANGYPKPQIYWLFNGSSLFPKNTLLSLSQEQLLLMEVGWLHVGNYTCIATNNEGTQQVTAAITVQVPPVVQRITGVPLLYLGEHLQLECHATGIPDPVLEWYFNREPIVESNNGRITIPEPSKLSVKFVTNQDEGVYMCKGINNAGVSQREIDVYIVSRPSPPVLYRVETVDAESVRLTWSIEQLQPQTPVDKVIIYYRKRQGAAGVYTEVQLDSSIFEYTLEALDPASEYVFMLTAVNQAGTSDTSNVLSARTMDTGPSEPRNLKLEQISAFNATISWEIPSQTNGVIRKYQIKFGQTDGGQLYESQVNSENTPSHDHVLEELIPYTWYSVQVRGATKEGDKLLWGNWTDTVTFKTLQAAPSRSARELRAQPLSPDVIQVNWEAVPQELQNGPIKRYYVTYWLLKNLTTPLGEEVVQSLDLHVNITDLDPWTWYLVRVTPENIGGKGLESAPVSVRTLPTAPTGPPLNVTGVSTSSYTISVTWQMPLPETWNSEISGFHVQYWSEDSVGSSTTLDTQNLRYTIRDLDPHTFYTICVSAFTHLVSDGEGPCSDNITVKTQQAEPGTIQDLRYTATTTSLRVLWRKPEVLNGIISHYLVIYYTSGPVIVTTLTPPPEPLIADYVDALLNDTDTLADIFVTLDPTSLNKDILTPVANLCDLLLSNTTLFGSFANVTNVYELSQSDYRIEVNISQVISDWLILSETPIGTMCQQLSLAVNTLIDSTQVENEVIPVLYNQTTTATSLALKELLDAHVYNITVFAATDAGYGPASSIIASTAALSPTTKRPSTPPLTLPITRAPSTKNPEAVKDEPLNLPVIIGGGSAGLVLLIVIIVVLACFIVRRRDKSEEKAKVLQRDSMSEDVHNTMYGELDRPRNSIVASAAEDGADSLDMFGDSVPYPSAGLQKSQSTTNYTEGSSTPTVSNGRRIKEAFLGMEDPSYLGLSAPTSVKNNPAYYEEPYSSDQESMVMSMALSSEGTLNRYQAGDTLASRKYKMRNQQAAVIAKHQTRSLPAEIIQEHDQSSRIHNNSTVVYNERTAL